MKRVMGIIRGYTVEARPSLKVRAPLENFNTREHTFVIDQTTVRWSRSKGQNRKCWSRMRPKKKWVSPAGNRTRASRVRVSYPNQLDYGGRSWIIRIALRYDAEVVI